MIQFLKISVCTYMYEWVIVTQSCLTLCDVMDCSPPGSSVHGILSRQEYWSGLPFPSPGDLANSGITPGSPALQADSVLTEPPGPPLLMTFWIQLQSLLVWMTHSCPPLPGSLTAVLSKSARVTLTSQPGRSLFSKPLPDLPSHISKSQRGWLSAPHTSILLSHQPQSLLLFRLFILLRSHWSPCSADAPGPVSQPLHMIAPLLLSTRPPQGSSPPWPQGGLQWPPWGKLKLCVLTSPSGYSSFTFLRGMSHHWMYYVISLVQFI